jgi:hypothetical protein
MKYFFLLSTLLFSHLIFANPQSVRPTICYTSGECATQFGISSEAVSFKLCNGTTEARYLPVTYTCVLFPGKVYGACEKEMAGINPQTPDACANDSEIP